MKNEIKFVCDIMLKNLTRWLRMFNIEALYPPSENDTDVVSFALEHDAIILTKDKEMCKRKAAKKCYLIMSDNIDDMLFEVFKKFKLELPDKFYPNFCPICNGMLKIMSKDDVEKEKSKIPIKVLNNVKQFWKCNNCGKIFWKGTHWKKINKRLENLKSRLSQE